MQRTRILFVDDDPAILRAMRNVLRRDAARWDLAFAEGGRAGLDAIHGGTFDVVVSDLRMPDVDGLHLLTAVAATAPETVRIIMSGDIEHDEGQRARELTHAVLDKPCTPTVLRATIERVLAARACALAS